jgi:hypothetical protein
MKKAGTSKDAGLREWITLDEIGQAREPQPC